MKLYSKRHPNKPEPVTINLIKVPTKTVHYIDVGNMSAELVKSCIEALRVDMLKEFNKMDRGLV